jgi:hypothetical protein
MGGITDVTGDYTVGFDLIDGDFSDRSGKIPGQPGFPGDCSVLAE